MKARQQNPTYALVNSVLLALALCACAPSAAETEPDAATTLDETLYGSAPTARARAGYLSPVFDDSKCIQLTNQNVTFSPCGAHSTVWTLSGSQLFDANTNSCLRTLPGSSDVTTVTCDPNNPAKPYQHWTYRGESLPGR